MWDHVSRHTTGAVDSICFYEVIEIGITMIIQRIKIPLNAAKITSAELAMSVIQGIPGSKSAVPPVDSVSVPNVVLKLPLVDS